VKAFVATKNLGKLDELRAIFSGSILDLDSYPDYAEPEEDGATYLDNARLKAQALRAQLQAVGGSAAVLADDSGLEVRVLDGAPGIFSARYGGGSIAWTERRRKVLAAMDGVPLAERVARFVCALVLISPDGEEHSGTGTVDGILTTGERGTGGFGYDPLFYYPPLKRTFAELSEHEKNGVSHRRRAADALLVALSP
jgi:XTP/dITP diphosphohydrolase